MGGMPMDRPNILFFFTDQQRFDTCGCYGQRLPVTPNLDRLAKRGTVSYTHLDVYKRQVDMKSRVKYLYKQEYLVSVRLLPPGKEPDYPRGLDEYLSLIHI